MSLVDGVSGGSKLEGVEGCVEESLVKPDERYALLMKRKFVSIKRFEATKARE